MNPTTTPAAFSHEQHQQLAYQLWEKASRPAGKDIDFWLDAQLQLSAMRAAPPAAVRKNNSKAKAANRAKTAPGNSAKKAGPTGARNGKKLHQPA